MKKKKRLKKNRLTKKDRDQLRKILYKLNDLGCQLSNEGKPIEFDLSHESFRMDFIETLDALNESARLGYLTSSTDDEIESIVYDIEYRLREAKYAIDSSLELSDILADKLFLIRGIK